jgi:polysaccharide pyruvyl transferase WcaK-like protein
LKVLVFGFYYKNSIGDDLFKEAFKFLFPQLDFIFTDRITKDQLALVSTVFIGGGSFLETNLDIKTEVFLLLKTKNIFYIGIGAETEISYDHKQLLSIAKLIAIRTPKHIDKIKSINTKTIIIPDLVYALPKYQHSIKENKSILILPNAHIIPKWFDEHYKHIAWDAFKSEFAQFLDVLIEEGYKVNFFSMCSSQYIDDSWATTSIISSMRYGDGIYNIGQKCIDMASIIELFSKYQLILTQRYHGIILSDILNINHIAVSHHNKIASNNTIPYYGLSKKSLLDNFYSSVNNPYSGITVERDFNELKHELEKNDAICWDKK